MSATFQLTIDLGNAAFDPDPRGELMRILAEVSARIGRSEAGAKWETVHDINGNPVGRWRIAPEPRGRRRP